MLGRLLRDLPPNEYCLLSYQNYDSCPAAEKLPAPYHRLSRNTERKIQSRSPWQLVRQGWRGANTFRHHVRAVAEILQRENCDALLACTGDIYDLPAGFLASRRAGIPFYAYVFDDYVCQWMRRRHRLFARWWAPRLFGRAAGVIVPNEFLAEEYRRRYGIKPAVIHNACEVTEDGETRATPWPATAGEVRIVYTGAVYQAHFDAFRNLLAAIGQLERPDVRLHLYTAQPLAELEREKIVGPIVCHPHMALAQAREVQQQGDILFLPLAFESPYPEVIKTSAPGKLGEYLAAGRPILVHAPSDSFVSWYFKTHECGLVVERSEPSLLAAALRRIVADDELRRKLTANARARAKADFSLAVARRDFKRLLWGED
jgi:glycosyltransferase involved in cell wall biosynthesis